MKNNIGGFLQLQTLVPGGMLVDSGDDVQFRHPGTRQERRDGRHGRPTQTRPHLHRRTHRHFGVGTPGRGDLRPGPGGQS
jgi:hypothetical protein